MLGHERAAAQPSSEITSAGHSPGHLHPEQELVQGLLTSRAAHDALATRGSTSDVGVAWPTCRGRGGWGLSTPDHHPTLEDAGWTVERDNNAIPQLVARPFPGRRVLSKGCTETAAPGRGNLFSLAVGAPVSVARILLEGPVTVTETGPVSRVRKASKTRPPPTGRGGGSTPQVVAYYRTGQLGRGVFACKWPPLVAYCWRTNGHDLPYIASARARLRW